VTIWTNATPGQGAPGSAFHDKVLIPNNAARGTVTFYLCDPTQVTKAGCPKGKGSTIGGKHKIIGDHKVFSADAKGKRTQAPGLYCWRVRYSGDESFAPANESNRDTECFTVKK